MKRSKFFSLSLMREGIKQTMGVGICLLLVSMFVSGYSPFVRMFTGNWYGGYTVIFGMFFSPMFFMGYIMPMIFVFALFGFMNKRNSSDFYHSVPLNRTCVYITYAATAMLWCIFITTVSTLFSYSLYMMNTDLTISSEFIGTTIGTTFVLMLLIASIALVAKGLSGTTFSNIAIMFLLMLLPRIILELFISAIQTATPVVYASSLPIADFSWNIIFLPLSFSSANPDTWSVSASTIWYSVILAILYLVAGLFIHRARKSETAETSSSFKWVQHIVRSLIGIIPTILIIYPLAERTGNIPTSTFIIAIVVSLLAYFFYELATTRSTKKLLYAIPLYLIVVAFDCAFVFGSYAISNSIVSYVPDKSEVKSVSVSDGWQNYAYSSTYLYNTSEGIPYSSYLLGDCEYQDEEIIDILCSSLADDVKYIQNGTFNEYRYYGYSKSGNNPNRYGVETYNVTFHLKDGNDVKRIVYLLNMDYYFDGDDGNQSNRLDQLIKDSNTYKNARTKLPDDNEIVTISIGGDFSNAVKEIPQSELEELWKIYKEEYNSLSTDDKVKITVDNNYEYSYDTSSPDIFVNGYTETHSFSSIYTMDSDKTPKAMQKLSEIYNKYRNDNSSETLEKVLSGIDTKKHFSVSMKNISTNYSYDLNINNDVYYDDKEHVENTINVTIPDDKYISKMYEGTLSESDIAEFQSYYNELQSNDFDNIKKSVKIITDAAQKDCNFADKRTFAVEIYSEYEKVDRYSYSYGEINYYFINLTKEQYKELYDNLTKADNTNKQNEQ